MRPHAPLTMDARCVLISQRDWLTLDWFLHHSRWMLSEVFSNATAIASPYRMPELSTMDRWQRRESERGGLTPDKYNAARDRQWENAREMLAAHAAKHDAELAWWLANKDTAPLDLLRQGVRTMMSAAGGARSEVLDLAEAPTEADPPREIRSLRWLLSIRGEIARRRMYCGEALLIVSEAHERDFGHEWAYERLGAYGMSAPGTLGHRINEMRYRDPASDGAPTAKLAQLVKRREAAAAAHGSVGHFREVPGINYDGMGAGDTVS